MYSPFGFDTRPRMPASWTTWVMLPAAPDFTIMLIELSSGKFFSMASATWSLASVQTLTSSALRSW